MKPVRFLLSILAMTCSVMLCGCMATQADETYRQRIEDSEKRAAAPVPKASNLTGVDKEVCCVGRISSTAKRYVSVVMGPMVISSKSVIHP